MKIRRFIFLIIFLFLFIQISLAQDVEIMPVKDIRPGMKGYGLSVFKGTKIEKFPITVLGVTRKFTGVLDTIIIRVDGGYCVEHQIGIIAGMSGSPVYIDGKLIGAIAYGGIFDKEAIGGVQPIEGMLKVLNANENLSASDKFSNILEKPVKIKDKEFHKIKISDNIDQPSSPDTIVLSSIKSIFFVSGLDSESVDRLNNKFKNRAIFQNNITGGGYYYTKENIPLEPGSAIGVPLMKGDMVVYTFGTLTYKKDNQILAFGHQLFNRGKVKIPLATVYVHDIFPSYMVSTKMGSLVKEVGTLYEDRVPAIAGKLGTIPLMIPAAIEVVNQRNNFAKKYNIEVVDLGLDTAFLLEEAVYGAISLSGAETGLNTAKLNYEIYLNNNKTIKLKNLFFDPVDVESPLTKEFGKTLVDLLDNKFVPLEIKNVKVNLEITPEQKTAQIQKIYLSKNKVKPGETIQVHILFKPYKGALEEKIIPVEIPADIKKGVISLGVCGGADFITLRRKLDLDPPVSTNINQFLRNLEEKETNNQIILKVVLPQDSLDIAGEKFYQMPSSRLQILDSSAQSDIKLEKDVITRTLDTPYIVAGWGLADIKVTDYESGEEKTEPEKKDKDTEETKDETSAGLNSDYIKVNTLNLAADQTDKDKKETKPAPKVEPEEPKKEADKGAEPEKPEESSVVLPFTQSSWIQSDYAQFKKGAMFNTVISDLGYVALGPERQNLFSSESNFLWAAAYNKKDNTLITADSEGEIWKISYGKKEILTTLPSYTMVNSLAIDQNGFIWAATSPRGELYKITPVGHSPLGQKSVFKIKALHLWKVLIGPDGQIFVSTGAPGNIYKVSQNGSLSLYFSVSDTHIKAMIFDKSGHLVVGTGNSGLVYKIESPQKAKVIFQNKNSTIEDLVYDSKGNLYVAAGSKLTKITPDGKFYNYGFSEKFITALAVNSKDEILIGVSLDGRIYKLTPDEQSILVCDLKANSVLSFAKDNQDNLYFTTGNKANLFKLSSNLSHRGSFESEVFDTVNLSKFGIIRWTGKVPPGARLNLQTRAGNSLAPSASWSSWSGEYDLSSGDIIKTSPARFLQYKVNFSSNSNGESPILDGLEIYYKSLDKIPYLYFVQPNVFERWSGEKEIEWAAGDANLDTLGFALFYSKDNENKWNLIEDNISVVLKKKETEEDINPESHKQVYLWDTKKIPDGKYQLKLLAYNRFYPENKNLQGIAVSKPLVICNTKPEIKILSKNLEKEKIIIKGVIKSSLVFPVQVKYSFDKKDWKLALPSDGMYGGFEKEFLIQDSLPKNFKPSKTGDIIFIQGKDEAGNVVDLEEKL